MEPIRVLIVDDHPVFRFGLAALLASLPEMEVVGEVSDGAAAVLEAARLKPDVILMDVNMPGLNGIEATRRILQHDPDTGILVITMLDDETVFTAMQAGARGYVLKGADPEEMIRAIHAVAEGEAIFSPNVAARLIEYFARERRPATPDPFPELTGREREVLDLIAQGLTNTGIAERLVISPKTARNHVSNIFGKLQVANRAEAIVRARRAGLGREGDGPPHAP